MPRSAARSSFFKPLPCSHSPNSQCSTNSMSYKEIDDVVAGNFSLVARTRLGLDAVEQRPEMFRNHSRALIVKHTVVPAG
jgi:hypothetical protein